jgi:hypothetical protein
MRDGLSSWCAGFHTEATRRWRHENPQKVEAYNAAARAVVRAAVGGRADGVAMAFLAVRGMSTPTNSYETPDGPERGPELARPQLSLPLSSCRR